jgi:hypothetical protein
LWVGQLKTPIVASIVYGLDCLSQKTPMSILKKYTFFLGDGIEDTAFEQGLELLNPKPDCRITALHFFVT